MLPRLMEPFRGRGENRLTISGERVKLAPAIAPSLALALHELAANAVQHGSLAGATGSVAVTWSEAAHEQGSRLKLKWEERGGKPIPTAPRRGFGLRLIERAITYQLHGETKFSFVPVGLRVEFNIPLVADQLSSGSFHKSVEVKIPSSLPPPSIQDFSGLRVLVVEDDYLVAESLQGMLRGMGCQIVGPVSTADDACRLVKQEMVDAAILDVNLSPGSSAPVARALQYKRCPFMFLTGYSMAGLLPDDLRGYRVLAKPVDPLTLRSAIHELSRNKQA